MNADDPNLQINVSAEYICAGNSNIYNIFLIDFIYYLQDAAKLNKYLHQLWKIFIVKNAVGEYSIKKEQKIQLNMKLVKIQ